MKIYNSIEELVGNTKLFYIKRYCDAKNISAKICLKLESANPAGSIKDRAALYMINEAEKQGKLSKGSVIIEPTSGNTGIGLAAIGRAKGYRVVLTMPDSMSAERRNLLAAYGAEIHLTPGKDGMKGAIAEAEAIKSDFEKNGIKCIIPGQFDNPANIMAHFETTGPEIWRDTDGEVAAFVAGIGTGGTLSGTAKYLKSQNKNICTVGVEPEASPMITKGESGAHKLQGIGANFVPDNFLPEYCDEVITVSNEAAYEAGQNVAKTEGILIGISGGAALSAAEELVRRGGYDGKIIVVIAPDSGEHYLSVQGYFVEE